MAGEQTYMVCIALGLVLPLMLLISLIYLIDSGVNMVAGLMVPLHSLVMYWILLSKLW